MTHTQIRSFCHGITFAAFLFFSTRKKSGKYFIRRYGCERYTDKKNSEDPDFYGNITLIPAVKGGKESHSKCGYALEANYDHKYNIKHGSKQFIRIFWGVRNDSIGGVLNPEIIYSFMKAYPSCCTIDKKYNEMNSDHWIVWILLCEIDLSSLDEVKTDEDARKKGREYFENSVKKMIEEKIHDIEKMQRK